MKNHCVYLPKDKSRQELFLKLKSHFGYQKASFVYNRVTGEQFMSKYKDSLTLSGGIPTFESVIANELVRAYLGRDTILDAMTSNQPKMQDTVENMSILVGKAHDFNINPENSDYVAIVDNIEGQLTLRILNRTLESIDQAMNQYKICSLNERIAKILSPIGISMSVLSSYDVSAGRVGLTDFNKAVDAANGIASMMYVANNMEGSKAISEEFSHFIVGVYRNDPLVRRSLSALSNEETARQILGDQYDSVSEFHNGNLQLIAEEALGHILRDTLLQQDSPANLESPKNRSGLKSLFRRAIDYIVNLFKGYSPSSITEAIDYVNSNMSQLASEVLSGERKIEKKNVEQAQRDARFNALSEKAEAQIVVLKGIEERAYKNIHLQQNLEGEGMVDYKKRASRFATNIHKIFRGDFKEEETMAAIASYLKLSTSNLEKMFSELGKIEDLSIGNRFTLLRNALYTLQAYQPTIKELKDITESAFLEDEHIASQRFVIGDADNSLSQFEVNDDIESVNTSSMSIQDIVDKITSDSGDWALSDDETHYVNKKTGESAMRVTSVVSASLGEEAFDHNSPWYTPSTNIGTGVDEFIRDFLAGRIAKDSNGVFTIEGKALDQVYPNADNKSLQEFAKSLESFQEEQRKKGITLISRDVTVNGVITTLDGTGRPHKISTAGTLDLLGYDSNGNWYVYDIKTYRSDIDEEKQNKYAQQITLYKDFLEHKYGIKVKGMAILPVKVSYPAPAGARGSVVYTVDETIPDGYQGKKGNQLKVNGKIFKGSKPSLQDLVQTVSRKTNLGYGELSGVEGNENVEAMLDALTTVDRLFTQFSNRFNEVSMKYFTDYLKFFIGENIKIRETDEETGKFTGRMKEVAIEKLIAESPKDVTMAQRWLTTMADNPDAFLQIYAKIVSVKKNEKRIKVIEKSQEILALGKVYEKMGITSYDWMYEDDKKNYVMHYEVGGRDYSYDRSAYEAAKAAYKKQLDDLYGQYPEIGSSDYENKKAALLNWIDKNTIVIDVEKVNKKGRTISHPVTIPSPRIYPSRYNSLTDTQKEFLDKWMAIKTELDSYLPSDATSATNTIKIRKSGYERLKGVLHGSGVTEFVEGVKSKVMQSFDDDLNYSRGIKGFTGEEVMRLPLFYINSNETQDITTDAIGSLIAYADMVYNYDAMSQVVNPLEIGKFIAQSRRVSKLKNGLKTFEEFSFGTMNIKNPLYEDNTSNFMAMLDEFMESKVYGKYLKDNGSWEIKGKQIDKNKVASVALKVGSTVQLGFNALAGLANVATGVAMQNIEAAAGEFFTARELLNADKEFMAASPGFLTDIGQRVKTSKLALFDQMFDVRQQFSTNIRNVNFANRNLLLRIFGPNLQYICQDAGDHWLYNRSAIAMALKYKLKLVDDTGHESEMSLWDALEAVDIDANHPEAGKKLVLKKGVVKLDGSAFSQDDITEFTDKIGYINRHCFGVYNQEDSIAARRTILGRFLMQYRDWIPAQFRYRLGSKTTNLNKGGEVEGYYRTFGRFIADLAGELKQGELNIGQTWEELEDYEKANIKRAIAECLQLIGVYIVAGLLKGKDPDKEHSWARNTLAYLFTREKTELGALVPLSMPGEMINIVKSPFAATSVASDIYNLRLLLNPRNYMDEIQSGDYKGHSTAYRAFMRSPLTVYYRTIKRNMSPEKASTFYDK